MKKLFTSIVCILLAGSVYGQQRPQYSLYMQNNYILNPAIAGIEDYLDLKLSHRSQWVGLEAAPVTSYVSIQGPLGDVSSRHHGIGGYVASDKTGPTSRLSFDGTYAYHLPVTGNIKAALGIGGGFTQYTTDGRLLNPVESDDPAIAQSLVSQILPDLSAGLWLYSDRFYIGASGLQLISAKLNYGSAGVPSEEATFGADEGTFRAHYFFTGGYRFPMGDNLSLIPSVMVKWIQPAPVSVDFNMKAQFQDIFWVGGSYRKGDSFSALAGFNISSLINVAYAYDYGVNGLGTFHNGSHEIMLGLQLNNKEKVRCPQNVW